MFYLIFEECMSFVSLPFCWFVLCKFINKYAWISIRNYHMLLGHMFPLKLVCIPYVVQLRDHSKELKNITFKGQEFFDTYFNHFTLLKIKRNRNRTRKLLQYTFIKANIKIFAFCQQDKRQYFGSINSFNPCLNN